MLFAMEEPYKRLEERCILMEKYTEVLLHLWRSFVENGGRGEASKNDAIGALGRKHIERRIAFLKDR